MKRLGLPYFMMAYYAIRSKQPDAKGIILWYQDQCRIYEDEFKANDNYWRNFPYEF